jgi:hypothetical protein
MAWLAFEYHGLFIVWKETSEVVHDLEMSMESVELTGDVEHC